MKRAVPLVSASSVPHRARFILAGSTHALGLAGASPYSEPGVVGPLPFFTMLARPTGTGSAPHNDGALCGVGPIFWSEISLASEQPRCPRDCRRGIRKGRCESGKVKHCPSHPGPVCQHPCWQLGGISPQTPLGVALQRAPLRLGAPISPRSFLEVARCSATPAAARRLDRKGLLEWAAAPAGKDPPPAIPRAPRLGLCPRPRQKRLGPAWTRRTPPESTGSPPGTTVP